MTKRIVVIGGGITGLSAAHRLCELQKERNLDLKVTLTEKSGKLGGPITTIIKDGFLIELGPDMFFTKKPWALDLSKRLGLENKLIETNESKRGTYVLWKNKLIAVPEGFLMLAPSKILPFLKTPLFSWLGKLRMLLDLFIPRGTKPDESLASFVRRRFGNEALVRMAQPMIGGIYTADPEKLSINATTPQFVEMEKKHRSVIMGMMRNSSDNKSDSGARYSQFLSFKDGMQTLIDTLEKNLPEGSISLNEGVSKITQDEDTWKIQTNQRTFEADGVIITTPSYNAATLLKDIDSELARELSVIEYASSALVIFVYRKDLISRKTDGFGFVVPAAENKDIIACSFSSIKFDRRCPENLIILRAFVGGALNPGICELSDDEIISRAENELKDILGIRGEPEFTRLQRYPLAMPQYHLGHLKLLEKINERTKNHLGLKLAGNAYYGVGIPECVHAGEKAAESLVKSLF